VVIYLAAVTLTAQTEALGWLAELAGPAFVGAVAIAAVAPIAVTGAYLALRARTRRREADGGQANPGARVVQATLAGILDRMDDDTPRAESMRRLVLQDRIVLSASVFSPRDAADDRFAFIWFVRPSQTTDYPLSPQFRSLSKCDQDAVVLLDLRRSLMLRGASETLAAESGFYHHDLGRIQEAAARTLNPELVERLASARLSAPDDQAAELTADLLRLVDDSRTWARLLATVD
jgi:hypothetical protein